MKFSQLADLFSKLEKESGNKLASLISDFLAKAPKNRIKVIAYFLNSEIAPEFKSHVIGLSENLIIRSISRAADVPVKKVKSLSVKTGDIGAAAEKLTKGKRSYDLAVVFKKIHDIAVAKGKGSQKKKIDLLSELLSHSNPKDAKYICRIILGKLRLGVGTKTILDSLALAFTDSKKNRKEIEHAFNVCPDIGKIAEAVAVKGLKGLKDIDVEVGRPVKMMLAQRVSSLKKIEDKMSLICVEDKYDGERVQIHKSGSKVTLFSRRLEDITSQFPDIVKAVKESINAKKIIVEGEIVAVKGSRLLSFQTLMKRRRKYDVQKYVKSVPVALFLFDILLINNKSLLHSDLLDRRKNLEKAVKSSKQLQIAKHKITKKIGDVESFFKKSIKRGSEGIIAKSCDKGSYYKAGVRAWQWIKWKKDYVSELSDSFDLAVVGAYYGKGKRKDYYGAILCACYNKNKDRFETFTKVGTGFTNTFLKKLPKILKSSISKKIPPRVSIKKQLSPDIFFHPEVIVEIEGAEITRSPSHTCGEKDNRGLALRFPRFKRIRKDKKPEQCTTTSEIERMYGKI